MYWINAKYYLKKRNIHFTDSRWPNEYDQTMTPMNLNNWTWPKLKPANLNLPTNLNFTSGVLLTSVPDVFFLVQERSDGASEAGGPVQADRTNIFFGVKLMFVSVVNFGHIPTLRFVGVKIFWSKSVILNWSCEIDSLKIRET